MKIYLVRHGIAVERDAPGVVSDAARELTPDGIEKMRRHARALRRIGGEPREVWTSPLIRARQTAEIIADAFDPRPTVQTVDALSPSGHFEELLVRLERFDNDVALVGHAPSLGQFASFLIGGPRNCEIPFKKGGIACIEAGDFHPPLRGELLWLLTPKVMGMMD